MGIYQQVREADGVLVVSDQRMDGANSDRAISTYVHEIRRQTAAGEPQYSYLRKTTKTSLNPPRFDEAAVDFPSRVWDLTAEGMLVLSAERDRYRIAFVAPDGEEVQVIDREFAPYQRSPEELKKIGRGPVFYGWWQDDSGEGQFRTHQACDQGAAGHGRWCGLGELVFCRPGIAGWCFSSL